MPDQPPATLINRASPGRRPETPYPRGLQSMCSETPCLCGLQRCLSANVLRVAAGRRRSGLRHGVDEGRALHQLVVKPGEVGVPFTPVDFGQAEFEIAQRTADADIPQRVLLA